MSIVKALNELSGKEANTIEKAIRNIDLGGGGGGKFVVHFTTDVETGGISADKTIEEIIEAKIAEKDIVGELDSVDILPLEGASEEEDYKSASFQKITLNISGEQIRYIDAAVIVMTKNGSEDTEIEFKFGSQELAPPPFSVDFYYDDNTGGYTCYCHKNEIISEITDRNPINANLYGIGINMHLNYCIYNDDIRFYWITYSTSSITFHSLSSGIHDESDWEYFEKTITFDA